MANGEKKVRLTLELERELYRSFHMRTATNGSHHIRVIRRLVSLYASGQIDLADFPDTSEPKLRRTS